MKLKLNDEQKAIHSIIDGPVWLDECQHGADYYVASFLGILPGPKVARFDLYVFDEHGHQHVCIRSGHEPGDYISPGTMMNFIRSATLHRQKLPQYWMAFQILEAFGCLTWQPDDKDYNHQKAK